MDSIRNFRDLGGIQTQFGTLKNNKLLRGGPLSNVNDIDIDKLKNHYNLTCVIDFRNSHEVNNEPNVKIPGVSNYNFYIMRENGLSANPKDMLDTLEVTMNSDFMYPIYEEFVSQDHANHGYRSFIEKLANNNEGATYIHCTAGKDRTGFAAALVLRLLGADYDTILIDYLKTNNHVEKHRDQLIASVTKFHPFNTEDEALVFDILGVKQAYLDTTFKTIDKVYGDFDTYLTKGLGINEQTIRRLRMNLLNNYKED